MNEVMRKAQELAEAVVNSEVYRKMADLEKSVKKDPEATQALSDMIEKRQAVENLLASADMKPDDLAAASLEMEEAEKRMNENAMIRDLKEARKTFQIMMDNVNMILKLVITGDGSSGEPGQACCPGNCGDCGKCL